MLINMINIHDENSLLLQIAKNKDIGTWKKKLYTIRPTFDLLQKC